MPSPLPIRVQCQAETEGQIWVPSSKNDNSTTVLWNWKVTETHFYNNNLNNQNKAELISVTKPFPNNEFNKVIWHSLLGMQCPSLTGSEKSVFYPI